MTDVYMPTPCQCGFDRAVIFDVNRIRCVGCGADRGLLPREATILIATITAKFGEPPTVTIRKTSTAPAPEQPTNTSAHTPQTEQGTTMKSSDAFPSRFFKALNLKNKPRRVVIDHVGHEELNDEEKHILYFRDEPKQLVLNKTNWETIEELHGDSEDWPGQAIELFADKTTYQGKRTDCVRVRAATKAKPAKSTRKNRATASTTRRSIFDATADRAGASRPVPFFQENTL